MDERYKKYHFSEFSVCARQGCKCLMSIILFHPRHNPMAQVLYCPHFTDKETEV